MRRLTRSGTFFLLSVLFVSVLLHPRPAEAGIYDTDAEVTYKEYWVSHSEFTAGCGSHEVPAGGSWYLEPWPCTKTLAFEIPDDFSQALKAEIYLDLWRNHAAQSARFSLNGGPTHAPDVGYDWSRTPYVAEIPKSELQQGANTITLWNAAGGYHVHDIGFRIYHDDGHPLLPGSGSDVTPPDGQLASIVASNGTFLPTPGGTLVVDDDQVTLNATASGGDVKFVEFHAYYYGYDEDNDGEFLDWHNLGRNNFHPGGVYAQPRGGTIDHIGTDTGAPYTATWNLPHIQNQSGVKFKIRVVDNAGNVREAAGGVSGDFTLSRDDTVETHVIPGFRDAVLHHGGTYPDIVTRFIDLPDNLSDVSKAHIIGAYWQNPWIEINDNPQFKAFNSDEDVWKLSIKEVPISYLQPGQNRIDYLYNPAQISFGQFIEKPGPMIVLRRAPSSPPPDESPPFAYGHNPAPRATDVDPASSVSVHVADSGAGVATTTLTMTVEGTPVTPAVAGDPSDYTLVYNPPVDFSPGEVVTVTVDACDLHVPRHCMATEVYSFTVGVASPPVIDIWYGSVQEFGHIGAPQQWVNVLGNVSDVDGVDSLVYSLNGGPEVQLSIGPDARRLSSDGDFNVDLLRTDLVSGTNQVVITATDSFSHQSVETVTIEYVSGSVWPNPYSVDWSTVTSIQDAAQVVDGKWAVEAGSVRPVEVGYDRLVAMGDLAWTDYEVTVPITIHSVDIAGSGGLGGGPGLGLLMRWTGHTDSPISGWQPKAGWEPYGAIGWWRWESLASATLQFHETGVSQSFVPTVEVPYVFKMRVESTPGQGGFYRLKAWEEGQPEPSAWNLSHQTDASNLANGSFLLLAHHVDASFGDVTVAPGPFADTTPPVISDVQVAPGETFAEVTWSTDEPATSTVSYGRSAAYEDGDVGDNALVTDHTIILTGLISDTLYHYQVASADGSGNVASSTDLTFTTAGAPGSPSNIVSDDFSACSLDTGLWMFISPRSDVTQTMMGAFTTDAWLSIGVPSGTSHDIWKDGNFAPRIMQPADDTDFEVEVKFESGVSQAYQMQGVLVEQDSDDFLRFELYSDGSGTRLYAAVFRPGSSTLLNPEPQYNEEITSANVAPLYMRVRQQGDWWMQSYSFDGVDWTTPVTFTHPLTVTAVGAYAANAGASPPAHTGYIDYFFNTASPILPEDGERNTLTVHRVGNGSVITDPAESNYGCGEVVTLTATADPGWTFAGWSGGLTGTDNPATVTMTGNRVITASFTAEEYALTVNRVGNGRVDKQPDQATYHYGDVVTLTATADPGWAFAGWSGALSGTDNPETITISGDAAVTASFTQDAYTLTVNTLGNGSVTVDPDQATYHYGEVVTLTATADLGWAFVRWSGALSGTDNPETIAITGDAIVTAIFTTQDEYTLTVNSVGRGSVEKDPDQATYHYGDVVTLTATADPGWTFAGWSGDLLSSSSMETITIIGSATVTATFNTHIFLPFVAHVLSWDVNGIGKDVDLNEAQGSVWEGARRADAALGHGDVTPVRLENSLNGHLLGAASPVAPDGPGDGGDTAGDTASPLIDQVHGEGARADSEGPVIDIWYGHSQRFGHIGNPQNYVNVLGNVSDPDGVGSLVYSLNGGPESALSIGPDTRRLAADGDFNIDLLYTDLVGGSNRVVITATDSLTHRSVETVTIEYVSGNVWPNPYSIDWNTAASIQDAAQVVDGKWAIAADSVRPLEIGYDRLVAIGDMSWTDYEVTVPITIHDVDMSTGPVSGWPGLGILMRWTGHTDSPISGWQPKTGWVPFGAIGWWRWSSLTSATLQFYQTGISQDFLPALGVRYIFRIGVESTPDQGGLYRLKAWQDGQPEPSAWNLTYQAGPSDLSHGSFLLLAHHVDASFGDVTVVPAGGATTTLAVTTVGSGSVAVDPDQPAYTYGQVVTLTAMPEAGWAFSGWSGSLVGTNNPALLSMTEDKVVTATFTRAEYTLTVHTVGSGRVVIQPVKSTYHYGDLVTFTAVPATGWTFASWSGDLTGGDVTTARTITGDTTVTATFIQDEYPLTVDTVGNGSVTVDPHRAGYHYGDVVMLTAAADPGWTFAGWSGDLSGADNPETITITGDTTVTATFTRDEYILTVNIVGSGRVDKDPDQDTYRYGDVVTLTATPDPPWSFLRWGGDLSGSANPETVTIIGTTSITATFTSYHIVLLLPLVVTQ